jgi:hypothetical protein
MKSGRPSAKFDMKAATRLKLKAQLTILLVAGWITQTCAPLLSMVAGLTVGDISPTVFGLLTGQRCC